jgi:hypothetical protein
VRHFMLGEHWADRQQAGEFERRDQECMHRFCFTWHILQWMCYCICSVSCVANVPIPPLSTRAANPPSSPKPPQRIAALKDSSLHMHMAMFWQRLPNVTRSCSPEKLQHQRHQPRGQWQSQMTHAHVHFRVHFVCHAATFLPIERWAANHHLTLTWLTRDGLHHTVCPPWLQWVHATFHLWHLPSPRRLWRHTRSTDKLWQLLLTFASLASEVGMGEFCEWLNILRNLRAEGTGRKSAAVAETVPTPAAVTETVPMPAAVTETVTQIHRHNTYTENDTLQTATHFISKVPDVYVCDVIVLRLPATWCIHQSRHHVISRRKTMTSHTKTSGTTYV